MIPTFDYPLPKTQTSDTSDILIPLIIVALAVIASAYLITRRQSNYQSNDLIEYDSDDEGRIRADPYYFVRYDQGMEDVINDHSMEGDRTFARVVHPRDFDGDKADLVSKLEMDRVRKAVRKARRLF